MLGAMIGDIAGSRFEWNNIKSKKFTLFTGDCFPTDDSIMSLAVAQALLNCKGDTGRLFDETVCQMQALGNDYPDAGYGGHFSWWLQQEDPKPYNSWGNGSAMRVSPCGDAAKTLEEAIELASITAGTTHNHPEGMKGAQATAAAIFLARSGKTKEEIHSYIEEHFYKIGFTLDEIRPTYEFDVSCQGSVPPALEAFFESTGFEDAIRNAISIGGDSDTLAAITGGIAEAYYGIPENVRKEACTYLDSVQLDILERFEERYLK